MNERSENVARTSNGKLDALIRRVNALIPDSVKPSTRISIHPCDWIELVNEIEDLQKRASPETGERRFTGPGYVLDTIRTLATADSLIDKPTATERIKLIADLCATILSPSEKASEQRTAAEEWENAKAVMSGEMPPCECTLRDKAPSAYHNAKCPRYVADKL